MEQQLELPGLSMPEAREDLTDWLSGPPPMVGWWETRLKASPLITSMRLWRGGPRVPTGAAAGYSRWSYPATPGDDSESHRLYVARVSPSTIDEDLVEWRGLRAPLPQGHYPYKLYADRVIRTRVTLLLPVKQRVKVVP